MQQQCSDITTSRFDDALAGDTVSVVSTDTSIDATTDAVVEADTPIHYSSWGVKAMLKKSSNKALLSNVYMEFVYLMDNGQLGLTDAEGANKLQVSSGDTIVAFYDNMSLLCSTYAIGYTVVFRGLYGTVSGTPTAEMTNQVTTSVVYFYDQKQVDEKPLQLVISGGGNAL